MGLPGVSLHRCMHIAAWAMSLGRAESLGCPRYKTHSHERYEMSAAQTGVRTAALSLLCTAAWPNLDRACFEGIARLAIGLEAMLDGCGITSEQQSGATLKGMQACGKLLTWIFAHFSCWASQSIDSFPGWDFLGGKCGLLYLGVQQDTAEAWCHFVCNSVTF